MAGEKVYILPSEIVRALDELHGSNETVEDKSITLQDGDEITLHGGPQHYKGSSWTERDYQAVIPSDEGPVMVAVWADPADPYREAALVATRSGEAWDYLNNEPPPEWVKEAVGKLGVETHVIKLET